MFKSEIEKTENTILVKIAWMDKDGNIHTEEKPFTDENKARYYTLKSAHDLLLIMVDHYIGHKFHLGNTDRYRSQILWQQSLRKCQDFKKWLFNGFIKSMKEVATYSKRMLPEMEKILPYQTNPSYNSSKFLLQQINEVCNYINQQLA